MSDHQARDLHQTLTTALQQSSHVARLLTDQQRTIEDLHEENRRLKQDVEEARKKVHAHEALAEASEQLERLFRQNVEKQAEIDSLKRELHAVRKREKRLTKPNPRNSSPVVTSDENLGSSPRTLPPPSAKSISKTSPCPADSPNGQENCEHPSPPRKRPRRSGNSEALPLQEVDVNTTIDAGRALVDPENSLERWAAAIPSVAEDGEDQSAKENFPAKDHKHPEKRHGGAQKRLGALLSTPSPGNQVISRPSSRNRNSTSPNLQEPKLEILRQSSSDLAVEAMKPVENTKRRFLPPKPKPAPGPEDEEPLRCRPTKRLNLSHFRLNPAANDGYDFAFSETVRDREKRKCLPGCTRNCCAGAVRLIMDTLGPDLQISDDDLLLEFLGPGSEQRIRTMTKLARENLIHDARVQRIANKYGKTHRNQHERAQSPVGFWDTGMPSTQEELRNREEARKREKQEVEKRYLEACKEGGKWIFADE